MSFRKRWLDTAYSEYRACCACQERHFKLSSRLPRQLLVAYHHQMVYAAFKSPQSSYDSLRPLLRTDVFIRYQRPLFFVDLIGYKAGSGKSGYFCDKSGTIDRLLQVRTCTPLLYRALYNRRCDPIKFRPKERPNLFRSISIRSSPPRRKCPKVVHVDNYSVDTYSSWTTTTVIKHNTVIDYIDRLSKRIATMRGAQSHIQQPKITLREMLPHILGVYHHPSSQEHNARQQQHQQAAGHDTMTANHDHRLDARNANRNVEANDPDTLAAEEAAYQGVRRKEEGTMAPEDTAEQDVLTNEEAANSTDQGMPVPQ